jgi:hypothetical protein
VDVTIELPRRQGSKASSVAQCAEVTARQPGRPDAVRRPQRRLRRPDRNAFGGNGCGFAESALYDESGLIGRATQSLAIRLRERAKDA